MRILYLALAVFIALNIGAACRTALAPLEPGCTKISGGLIHCPEDKISPRD